jgi:hypothetical protein
MDASIETEIEGHKFRHSDENLKQVVTQLEQALAALRQLDTQADEDEPEIEGHKFRHSDESLKQAVTQLEQALAALRELQGTRKA